MKPIAYFRSPFTSKFGIPRQSGVVEDVVGYVEFTKEYASPDAIRGIEDFDYLWLIWEFSENKCEVRSEKCEVNLTVRPPRLGGNERVGVFASRSPFRPNNLGLSCVKLSRVVETSYSTLHTPHLTLEVLGADLMDGTPIYDIKPYVAYTDSHPDARCGFVDTTEWKPLDVQMSPDVRSLMAKTFTQQEQRTIIAALSQDPRPHYHHDPNRIYGMPFAGHDIRFRVSPPDPQGGVSADTLSIIEIT